MRLLEGELGLTYVTGWSAVTRFAFALLRSDASTVETSVGANWYALVFGIAFCVTLATFFDRFVSQECLKV